VFTDSDSLSLWHWADVYANRELASSILKRDFDNSDLDEILTTPPWELATAYLVGVVRPLIIGIFKIAEESPFSAKSQRTPIPPLRMSSAVTEIDATWLHLETARAETDFLFGPRLGERQIDEEGSLLQMLGAENILLRFGQEWQAAIPDADIDSFIETYGLQDLVRALDCTPVEGLGFSQETERVYTLQLEYLAKGPGMHPLWELDADCVRQQLRERYDILEQLRTWVGNHDLAKDSSALSQPLPWVLIQPLEQLTEKHNLRPVDLLKRVGHIS